MKCEVSERAGALQELSRLLPDKANIIRDNGDIEIVKVTELGKRDMVLIHPGERAPADGKIVEGENRPWMSR